MSYLHCDLCFFVALLSFMSFFFRTLETIRMVTILFRPLKENRSHNLLLVTLTSFSKR